MNNQPMLRFVCVATFFVAASAHYQESVFNVRQFGATGKISENA